MARSVAFGAVAAVLWLASSAWAFDDSALPEGRGAACSSLCRSWMSLGQGEAADSAPAVANARAAATASETPPVAGMPADRPNRPVSPHVAKRHTAKPAAVAASHSRRSATAVRDPATGPAPAAEVTAEIAPPPAAAVPAKPAADILVAPPVVLPTPAMVAQDPAPAMPRSVAPAVADTAARAVAGSDRSATTPADAAPASAAVALPAPRPGVPAPGTPLGVKLGIYAVLALIGFSMVRRVRPRVQAEADPQPVARRSGTGRLSVRATRLPPEAAPA